MVARVQTYQEKTKKPKSAESSVHTKLKLQALHLVCKVPIGQNLWDNQKIYIITYISGWLEEKDSNKVEASYKIGRMFASYDVLKVCLIGKGSSAPEVIA